MFRKLHWVGFAFLSASISLAASFTPGDVFLSTTDKTVLEYTPTGTFVQKLDSGLGAAGLYGVLGDSAFDSSGNLYVSAHFAGVVKFDSRGNLVGLFGGGYTGGAYSVAIGPDSSVWVGQVYSNMILHMNPSGATIGAYSVATDNGSAGPIDISRDGKTLYYASGASVKRFDVGNNVQLSDFGTGGDYLETLRILPDGGVLATSLQDIVRLDPAGDIVQTYLTGSTELLTLTLDPNGLDFWTAEYYSGDVYKVNIATGAIDGHFRTGNALSNLPYLSGISVLAAPEPAALDLFCLAFVFVVTQAKWRRT